ncbi:MULTISPECIES: hypothetical protein [unclassified Methylobacterium]|uniref:hypothetical protein n=1 Tax=unclassified Methylobacterium TaxID=2615210 RepID=UPI0011C1EAC3|nr:MULTISPECIES: hypothetical protein [unclassified Methylobacterium]QEE39906.1 hypothetical protein FVA80_14030 [Methylobacterium sp. WL1]TXN51608.1 hypothetical protein FV241_30035 [Methylobacterium sp. WL2]
MRTIMKLMALIAAAMATTVQAVWESGRWVLRSVRSAFAPPVGAHAEVEQALDDIADTAQPEGLPKVAKAALLPHEEWGQVACAYAMSRLGTHPEPAMRHLDEETRGWLESLTDSECSRVILHGPARIEQHMSGIKPIHDFRLCTAPVDASKDWVIVGDRVEYRGRIAQTLPPMTKDEHQALVDEVFAELVQEAEEKGTAYAPA